jgi:fructose/tagatose bisphosphate aldolase
MPLIPIANLVQEAQRRRYALGYFESWDIASLQGTIDAAERARAPIIIGFNGEFLSDSGRRCEERLGWYGALGRAAAESARVPCGLIFNECPNDEWTRGAIDAGFNLVMPVAGDGGQATYAARTREIVRLAHGRGVAVEAELGLLPCGPTGAAGSYTDAAAAAEFVEATGVDLLAVSVGNVHIATSGTPRLDLGRLEALASAVAAPLVLHGGTGVSEQDLRAAVDLGVVKVNFGTYLKMAYLQALRGVLSGELPADPHETLGRGGAADLMVACRVAVRDAVSRRIGWLGCRGGADAWKFD